MDAKRGYVPEDDRNFSHEAIEKLKIASCHIRYLINEGYDLKRLPLSGIIICFRSARGLQSHEA